MLPASIYWVRFVKWVDRKYAVVRKVVERTKGSMRSDRLREREREREANVWLVVDGTSGTGRCVWDGGEEREY